MTFMAKLRRVFFVLAGALMVHFLATMLLALLIKRSKVRVGTLVENLYVVFFVAPHLILCRPWATVLSRHGLMEGEWWRAPSPVGMLLVNAMYFIMLVGLGLACQQMLRYEQRASRQ
jgi:ABC-type Fe3+ transport system permease subunit